MEKEQLNALAREIHNLVSFVEWQEWDDFPVRLRKFHGNYSLHFGDPSWDQDHRGYFGASSISPDTTLEDCVQLVKEMVEEIEDQIEEENS